MGVSSDEKGQEMKTSTKTFMIIAAAIITIVVIVDVLKG